MSAVPTPDELLGLGSASTTDADELLVDALRAAAGSRVPSLLHDAFQWRQGMLARVGGTVFRVTALADPVELEHFETGEKRSVPMSALLALRPGFDITIIPEPQNGASMLELVEMDDATRRMIDKLPLDGASAATVKETVTKVRWLQVLHKSGYYAFKASDLWEPDVIKLATDHGLPVRTPETLAAWEALANDDLTKLVPDYGSRGGKGAWRTDHRPREMLQQIVADIRSGKLTQIKMRLADVNTKLQADIREKNKEFAEGDGPFHPIPFLSLSTIERDFKSIVTHEERIRAKHGKRRADRLLKAYERRPKVDFPGGVSEFDDVNSKIFCISRSGLGWGRPWATFGVDQHSSYPVGAAMDNKPRSAQSAISAYVNSIEAKDLSAFGPELDGLKWHAMGYPVQPLFDNATYNNPRFVRLAVDAGDPSWAKPFEPTQKRQVEYFNGQLTEFWSTQPGWRGAKDDPDALKAGLMTAVMDVDVLWRRTMKWALGAYAKRPMKDGFTPEEKYLEVGQLALRPRMPPDTRRLRLMRTIAHPNSVKWTQSGIKILGLTYQSREAYAYWVRRPGGSMRVTPRVDPDDLTVLYVPIPDTYEILIVPCLDADYARGMTLYQHLLVMKMCRQKKLAHPSLADYYREREALRVLTEQTIRSGKITVRRAAERAGNLPKGKAPHEEAVHDVERLYEDLDSTEMEEGSEGWVLESIL